MKVEIFDLVLACNRSMRKVIQLDDLIENLLVYGLVNKDEFTKLQDEFYLSIEICYDKKFFANFIDICNSPNYIENL